MASGHRRSAVAEGMAEWTPYARASYDAVETTPRLSERPPTITGFPRHSGWSSCSTLAKNASRSTSSSARPLQVRSGMLKSEGFMPIFYLACAKKSDERAIQYGTRRIKSPGEVQHVARKHKYDYFEAFVRISAYAVEYAEKLSEFLKSHYDEEKKHGALPSSETFKMLGKLHEIEDASDDVTHEIAEHLADEFVTPIEREDIMMLSDELDTVVDELDEVIQHIYMYDLTLIVPEIIEMTDVVCDAVAAVHTMCEKFTHYKKSHSINSYIIAINNCEDRADRVYIRSVHHILKAAKEKNTPQSNIEANGITATLAALERCCDACEGAGSTVATVIMKNS